MTCCHSDFQATAIRCAHLPVSAAEVLGLLTGPNLQPPRLSMCICSWSCCTRCTTAPATRCTASAVCQGVSSGFDSQDEHGLVSAVECTQQGLYQSISVLPVRAAAQLTSSLSVHHGPAGIPKVQIPSQSRPVPYQCYLLDSLAHCDIVQH